MEWLRPVTACPGDQFAAGLVQSPGDIFVECLGIITVQMVAADH